ncbi:MAG: hypothetical protein HRT54_19445 [Colwellia sp.]|nr:hypothetical protein [Colwellia sp.]
MNKQLFTLLCLTLVSSFSYASSKDHQHFLGVFVGATHAQSESEFSYGIEYEFKFTPRWGAGLVYEKTDDAHHGDGVEVTLAALYLHPWQDLRLGVGFGKEEVGGGHPFKEDLTRVSVSYDFHIGGIGIAPTFAVDFVDGETATIFGIAIVKSF